MSTTGPDPSGAVRTRAEGRGSSPRPSGDTGFGRPTGTIVKIVLLFFVNAIAIWGILRMIDRSAWDWAIVAAIALVILDVIYIPSNRRIPPKYLFPGTVLLLLFAVYPVLYTVFISFTNYGTGNNLSKPQAIQQIEKQSIEADPNAPRYKLQVLAEGTDPATGQLAFLLESNSEPPQYFLGTADGLKPVPTDQVTKVGIRPTVPGYVPLNAGQAQARAAEIAAFAVPTPAGQVKNDGFGQAYVQRQRYVYVAENNTMRDTVTGTVYVEDNGAFVHTNADTGTVDRLDPGWRTFIGLDNYKRLFTDYRVRGPFFRVFVWTFVFATLSVATTFALGLLMALVFNTERLRGKGIFRSLLIIPYALPSFMTILVWQGMLNQQFGVINRIFGLDWPWLDGSTGWYSILPYFSILLVNLWLGYPYMFLVTTGALQGIPKDLNEAAFVDGATGLAAFRRVTFPLLLVAVSPLLISSFAYNFNNFNAIQLLTGGGPRSPAEEAGRTDILISYTYRIAFGTARGADYGFASAVSVIIFIIVASISAFSFRYTKTFEEVK